MKNKVVVVGSCNIDHRIKIEKMPGPGETVIGGSFSTGGGGKGANQAVAAVRAGAAVTFIARVGVDMFGNEAKDRLTKESINTEYVFQDPDAATGVAFIIVDERGENRIVVAAGANARLGKYDIGRASNELALAGVLLVQLESPIDAVQAAIDIAQKNGATVILNPAPAKALDDRILSSVDILTPNIVEAEMISGMKISDVKSLRRVASSLLEFGTKTVMITLGKRGVFVASKGKMELVPAFQAHALDSTGAGDVFSGSLAAFIVEGMSIEDGVRMASAAASISVTRMGAQVSAPFRSEIEEFLVNRGTFETENSKRI